MAKAPNNALGDGGKAGKVAIYIRVSTQFQIDKDSLPVQREELTKYAEYALDIKSYEIFEDAGYSAKNTDRPAYQRMMSRLRVGEFSHLLVWKIDRISRNLLDFAEMYRELKRLGVVFVSKNEQFDTSSAIGEAMLRIILVFAELERKMTSERTSAVLLSRAAKGQWNGGKAPYGYDYNRETKELTVNEDEAKIVRMIYDVYEDRHSLHAVTKYLNDRGYKTREGAFWNLSTAHRILTSPFYTGLYRYNLRCESRENGSSIIYRKPEEVVFCENQHPALVTKERQDAIIATLHSGYRFQSDYSRKNVHIFAGVVTCGYCGSLMTASIDRKRSDGKAPSHYGCSRHRRFYDCPNHYISDLKLAPFVLNYISNIIRASQNFDETVTIESLERQLLTGPIFKNVLGVERGGMEELYNSFKAGLQGVEYVPPLLRTPEASAVSEERDVLIAEKRKIERAQERLQRLFLFSDEGISEKDYVVQRGELLEALEAVDARLEQIEPELADISAISDAEFIAKASYFIMAQKLGGGAYIDYDNYIKKLDPQVVKDFIRSSVKNIRVKDHNVLSIIFRNGIEHRFMYEDKQNKTALAP